MKKILEWNVKKGLLYFRIGSEIIPFASHPICQVKWRDEFRTELAELGGWVKKKAIRIAMHPDQFVLINSPTVKIVKNSIKELSYHADLLEAMGLDLSAKIQIHVGGVYDDKEASIKRFVNVYQKLPLMVKQRLVIENDDRLYDLQDCLTINRQVNIPVLLDVFHHELLNRGESLAETMALVRKTWKDEDGVPLVDYSTQESGARKGKHAETVDLDHFKATMKILKKYDVDVMLEIKDKEKSALLLAGR